MAKCYIITCLVCEGLHQVARRDALTCSGACRVWLKRHPERLQEFQKTCGRLHVTPLYVLMAKAVTRLRPDLEKPISAGDLTLEEAQTSVARTSYELIAKNCKGRNSGEGS